MLSYATFLKLTSLVASAAKLASLKILKGPKQK